MQCNGALQSQPEGIKHVFCLQCKGLRSYNPITNQCNQCNNTIIPPLSFNKCNPQIEGKSPLRKSPPPYASPSHLMEGHHETGRIRLSPPPTPEHLKQSNVNNANNMEIIVDYDESSSDEYDDDNDRKELLQGEIINNENIESESTPPPTPPPISPANNKRKRKRKRQRYKHKKHNKERSRKKRKIVHPKQEDVISLISEDESHESHDTEILSLSSVSSSYHDYAKHKLNEYNKQNPIFVDSDDDVIFVSQTRKSPPRFNIKEEKSNNSENVAIEPMQIYLQDNHREVQMGNGNGNGNTWESFNLKEATLRSLKSLTNIKIPTKEAKQLIDSIRYGMHNIMGQCIDYQDRLVAMCIAILEIMDIDEGNIRQHSRFQRPQILVIAPRRHQALECRKMFMMISRFYKLYADCMIGGIPTYICIKKVMQGIDIITATPGKLSHLIRRKHIFSNYFCNLIMVAIDGATDISSSRDMMRDMDVIKSVCPKGIRVLYVDTVISTHSSQNGTQFIRGIDNNITNMRMERQRIDKVIETNNVKNTIQQFSHIYGFGNFWILKDMLKTFHSDRSIVFFNKKSILKKSADWFAANTNLNVAMIHGNCSNEQRERIRENWQVNGGILFATDLMNSGLSVSCKCIIQFDVPVFNPADNYFKRCLINNNKNCLMFSILHNKNDEKNDDEKNDDEKNFRLIETTLRIKTQEYYRYKDRNM